MWRLVLFFLVFGVLLSSCNESIESHEDVSIERYFFPSDSLEPYIYAYRNNENPLDEKFYRLINYNEGEEESFLIERYNASLKITEGFTLDLTNGFQIDDHMVVDAQGLKRKCNVTKNEYFPADFMSTSRFVSDFPFMVDSLIMIYDSKKAVFNKDTIAMVLGKSVPAIHLKDTVVTRLVNIETKEVLEGQTIIDYLYALNYGLVYWGHEDKSTYYELVNIFSDVWWMEVAQVPQIRIE